MPVGMLSTLSAPNLDPQLRRCYWPVVVLGQRLLGSPQKKGTAPHSWEFNLIQNVSYVRWRNLGQDYL